MRSCFILLLLLVVPCFSQYEISTNYVQVGSYQVETYDLVAGGAIGTGAAIGKVAGTTLGGALTGGLFIAGGLIYLEDRFLLEKFKEEHGAYPAYITQMQQPAQATRRAGGVDRASTSYHRSSVSNDSKFYGSLKRFNAVQSVKRDFSN